MGRGPARLSRRDAPLEAVSLRCSSSDARSGRDAFPQSFAATCVSRKVRLRDDADVLAAGVIQLCHRCLPQVHYVA